MEPFNAEDVLEFAVRIEENGEKFYRDAERAAKEDAAKELFHRLAGDESKHKEIFAMMLRRLDRSLGEMEDYPGEFLSHLRSYIDGKVVFKTDKDAGHDPRSILDTALQRELDSVIYYDSLKKFVAKEDLRVIDNIIDEEQRHFAELAGIRRTAK